MPPENEVAGTADETTTEVPTLQPPSEESLIVRPTEPPNPPDPVPDPPSAVAPVLMSDEEKAAVLASEALDSDRAIVQVGDTVMVRVGETDNAVYAPAIVTNVFGDTINACVFPDCGSPYPLTNIAQTGTKGDEKSAWFFR